MRAPWPSGMGEIADGSLVLDAACGIGEPALAVARQQQTADLRLRFDLTRAPATVTGWLTGTGLSTVRSELLRWDIRVPDFDAWWNYNTSAGPFNSLFGGLDDDGRQAARASMTRMASRAAAPRR